MTAYAKAVRDGKIVAGRAVRLACERHLRDLGDGKQRGLRWAPERARRVIAFFPKFLRLVEGVHADQPFVLEPFQQFIVGSLFGWVGRDGFRRFRHAYIEIAKGGGKSPLLAGVMLYCLIMDDEQGAEIYAAAVTRDQAKIVFADAMKMARASPALAKILVIGENNIAYEATRSFIRPVSSEARSLDGKRVHVAGVDELHEHPTSLVTDKMAAGTKARRQPLIIEITNAGYDRLSVCWQHHDYSLRVLERTTANDAWFAYVCQLDACDLCRVDGATQPREGCARCDDWRDERTWMKANPGLGRIVTMRYIREQIKNAQAMPAKESLVRRLNFCHWTESHSKWLDMESWHACAGEIPDMLLIGRPCFAGLDLGQTDDFAAFVRIWLLADGRVAVRSRFWLPAAALERHRERRQYDVWRRDGQLIITEGQVTDPDLIEAEALELSRASGVLRLAYDKRFAHQMALHFEGAGLDVLDVPQGWQLNAALRRLNDLVKQRKLLHDGDPILAWMAANAIVRHGTRGEIRLDKDKAQDKIDGIAALATAMEAMLIYVEAAPEGSQVFFCDPPPTADKPATEPAPEAQEGSTTLARERDEQGIWRRAEAWRTL